MSEYSFPNTLPNIRRVQEICLILMDERSNLFKNLDRYNLMEPIPEDKKWREWADKHKLEANQPISLAFAVARAEFLKKKNQKILNGLRDEKATRQQKLKDLKDSMRRKIKRIEKITGTKFDELRPETQSSSFYEHPQALPIIRQYWKTRRDIDYASDREKRVLGSATRPKELHVDKFCWQLSKIIQKSAKTGKAHNLAPSGYKLIATIINVFGLASENQTVNSVKNRISRFKKQLEKTTPPQVTRGVKIPPATCRSYLPEDPIFRH